MVSQQKRDYFGDKLTRAEREARQREKEERQALNNRRLGLLVFQISWFMAFVAMSVVNWQLRFSYPSWPPPNVEAMGVLLPSVATLGLFISVILARRSRHAVQADNMPQFMMLWQIALVLIGLFLTIMAFEWLRVSGEGTQYRPVFRLLTGFHSAHALVVGAFMVKVWSNTRYARYFDPSEDDQNDLIVRYGSQNFWAVEAASKMLDFVFVAWLLFYVVLYWWRSA